VTSTIDPVDLRLIDPVGDRRWQEFVAGHEASSLFHSVEWLLALQRTYGYEPVAFTVARDEQHLEAGLLFCRVKSWITGRRLVSLPFSDHCEPLVADPVLLSSMLESVAQSIDREGRYIEVRPVRPHSLPEGFALAGRFCWHSIDLTPSLAALFAGLHKSHTQRAIKKAERVGVSIEVERSAAALNAFYELHTMTRRRHGVPVQPFRWFTNLERAFGDRMRVYVARLGDRPVAAILTLEHKDTLVYKYGCSDDRYKSSGATPALFWRAIRDAKAAGLRELDLGRSDLDDDGLQAFKDHLGASRRSLSYYRYSDHSASRWGTRLAPAVVRTAQALVPRAVQARAGSSLYKHFA
jgi:hypothetical protein